MDNKGDFPDISDKGVYCLIFQNEECQLDAGGLKGTKLKGGYHIYVGSALGPGGLKRLKRHVMLSLNKDKKPRWHVDYLSISYVFELICVVYAFSGEAVECRVAGKLGECFNEYVSHFGSGDCRCPSHLFYSKKYPLLETRTAFSGLGIRCQTICFKK